MEKRHCRGHYRPRALRMAPTAQEPRKASLNLEVTRKGAPRLPARREGPVDSVRRGALIRQVPPAEEPAESAAKKRQCVRSHRLKERRERHQSISRGRLEPGVEQEGFHDPV